MSDPEALEVFNRRLDALLAGKSLPEAAPGAGSPDPALQGSLPADEQRALEIASRLAGLNLSLESRARYPLRRRLLAAPTAQPGVRRRSWQASLLRLTPGLALLLALMCVFVGVAAGLTATPTQAAVPGVEQTAARQPMIASAAKQPGAHPPQFNPLPVPTPLAQPTSGAFAPPIKTRLLTPGWSTPPGVQSPQDPGPKTGEP